MSRDDPNSSDANSPADANQAELRYADSIRSMKEEGGPEELATADFRKDETFEVATDVSTGHGAGRKLRVFGLLLALLAVLFVTAAVAGRRYVSNAMRENLPQLDGTLTVYGLAAPVTVERDARGVPHILAGSMEDLVFAQGFVTAQDRLWQMDLLRRHAAGELAAILGRSMLEHDRAGADSTDGCLRGRPRAWHALPADAEALAGGICARSQYLDHGEADEPPTGGISDASATSLPLWTPRDSHAGGAW
jgi:hypothetical protein